MDKTILRNLEEVYPTLLVKLCADGQVNYMPVQARLGADLDSFLRYCSTIKPRRYRIQDRREVYLSVRLSDHAGLEKHILSFTMDLSEGGCFVASSQVWEKKQKLYLDIICLKDRTPILCEVRWSRSWGINPFVPGMGLKFLRITKSQQEQLLEMFSPAMRKAI
ncbi:PilZ domain-containing protein [Geoalkalibacter subterraneus]|uniref:PilZ domain-containing protein n=1 Tax=Geoalkalibacter subterraneus TaxID=483547 RepID=UPI00130E075E|nr:PilZ domain-containing protein [Geoalkalibacter subterraneus]